MAGAEGIDAAMAAALAAHRAATRTAGAPPPAMEARPEVGDLVLLRRVRDRIDREYARPLSVPRLARGVGMSAGHLGRRFRAVYGESPYSYLMTRRIERAMALLARGDVSVTEACLAVGCSSPTTFSTRFAELTGMAPGHYRRRAAARAESGPGMPACLARRVLRPIRNRYAPPPPPA